MLFLFYLKPATQKGNHDKNQKISERQWLRWGEEYFQTRLSAPSLREAWTARSEAISGETQKW
ncbi:hypothetical protein BP422_18295 [Brevibacillus formosus]|uniref:Uncharacterized protein n=1 Tax=Brevibacillus formosus TaxID=54913 RepID=A0A220MJL8_9BACL|nr:hypothetical protein BP422_18295 [Brevibacillus formosus]